MGADPVFGPLKAIGDLIVGVTYQSVLLSVFLGLAALLLLVGLGVSLFIKYRLIGGRQAAQPDAGLTIGFFHPYCHAGGGGERVLWVALRAWQTRYPTAKFLIYTGDVEAAPDQILAQARHRFQITGLRAESIEFIYLHRRAWVEAPNYPMFTLLGQSLGSITL
eukprot:maker-scaffold555_size137745-snap-gene-0.20 protein:Tk04272 transcript:maker-scaffold555_size137745-snap-gene-0.20-mRNA-1 annotation:"asparagine-linked glycosylation protein 11-like protein"